MCLLLNMEEIKQYNILILGDYGVGKTFFINKLNEIKKFSDTKKYKFSGVNCINFCNDKINGAIIMFSYESHYSYKHIEFYHKKLVKVYGNIPIIICGNTFSKTENKLSQEMITYHIENNLKYFEISNNEEIIMRYLCNQIDNKLFFDNLQNYMNKFVETKDKEISELTSKIDLIKKLI